MLGLSATWQGLYCTALLMVLCAGICASMMAVLWRTPARYAAGCTLPVLICFVLPAVLSVVFCEIERKLGWIKEGDLKLN